MPSTLTSASQPLQPPALTCRSLSERPKRRRVFVVERVRERGAAAVLQRRDRLARARGEPVVLRVRDRALGAGLDAVGAEEAAPEVEPRGPPVVTRDGVGRARLDARAAAVGAAASRRGRGSAAEPLGQLRLDGRVRDRAMTVQAGGEDSQHRKAPRGSEIEAAVREVEALVAEREVGDLLAAQRHGQAHPVVERRVDDLVRGELARRRR